MIIRLSPCEIVALVVAQSVVLVVFVVLAIAAVRSFRRPTDALRPSTV